MQRLRSAFETGFEQIGKYAGASHARMELRFVILAAAALTAQSVLGGGQHNGQLDEIRAV